MTDRRTWIIRLYNLAVSNRYDLEVSDHLMALAEHINGGILELVDDKLILLENPEDGFIVGA